MPEKRRSPTATSVTLALERQSSPEDGSDRGSRERRVRFSDRDRLERRRVTGGVAGRRAGERSASAETTCVSTASGIDAEVGTARPRLPSSRSRRPQRPRGAVSATKPVGALNPAPPVPNSSTPRRRRSWCVSQVRSRGRWKSPIGSDVGRLRRESYEAVRARLCGRRGLHQDPTAVVATKPIRRTVVPLLAVDPLIVLLAPLGVGGSLPKAVLAFHPLRRCRALAGVSSLPTRGFRARGGVDVSVVEAPHRRTSQHPSTC